MMQIECHVSCFQMVSLSVSIRIEIKMLDCLIVMNTIIVTLLEK